MFNPTDETDMVTSNFSGGSATGGVSSEEAFCPLPNSSGDRRSPSELVVSRLSAPWPEIIYIYDAEKVEENTKTIILPQLYTEAITQSIQDISTTTDEEASEQIFTENIIESQYEKGLFYINHIGVCFILSIICMLILIMIFQPR